jgi:hypothetical protein
VVSFKPNLFFRERARAALREEAEKMAPFGDGGWGGDGGEALLGRDPLRSGSAPPTMEAGAEAAVAAERVFGSVGGGASFFSGIDGRGLGARMDEVTMRHGAAGVQVRGVAALELIDGFGLVDVVWIGKIGVCHCHCSVDGPLNINSMFLCSLMVGLGFVFWPFIKY